MSTIYIDLEATCGADPGSYLFHSLDISLVDDIGFPFPRCCLRRLCLGRIVPLRRIRGREKRRYGRIMRCRQGSLKVFFDESG